MAIDWTGRRLWHRIGYALTAAWMVYVIYATGKDVEHPLFAYIFVVPLAGWIAGLVVASLIKRRRRAPPPPEGGG